jgi:hypothetical protein
MLDKDAWVLRQPGAMDPSPVLDCHAPALDKNAYDLPRVPISILGNGVNIRATRMYIMILWELMAENLTMLCKP